MDRAIEKGVPREVQAVYGAARSPITISVLPGGHIHQNFLVTSVPGLDVLQKLHGRVFPDIAAVLSNVERVVAHLRSKSHLCPPLIETTSGALSDQAADGSAWRTFSYLEGTDDLIAVTGPAVAFETARAFTDYREAISDLPGPPLAVTIERFHDHPRQREDLEVVVNSDPVGRLRDVRCQIDQARRLGRMVPESRAHSYGQPERRVHNDANKSNVRFDVGTGLAACVIDLDTTMAGRVRCHVGELVRTITTHALEDSSGDSAVHYHLDLLEALVKGYFCRYRELAPEVGALAWAGPEPAVENGVGFLTDHLSGDPYFRHRRAGRNLARCRTQLRLAELMLARLSETDACFSRAMPPGPASSTSTAATIDDAPEKSP